MGIFIFIFYLFIPIISIFRLFRATHNNFWSWLSESSFYVTYMIYIYFVGVWAMTYGKVVLYILSGLFAISYVYSIIRLRKALAFRIQGLRSYLKVGIYTVLFIVYFPIVYFIYCGYQKPDSYIALSFPLKKGVYEIVHGGGDEILNHHQPVLAQRFALDIVQTNGLGLRSCAWPKKLRDYHIYEAEVFSPCNGTIIVAKDGLEDQKPGIMDEKNLGGNFIAISNDQLNAIVVLAHLQKGSLGVQEGDQVFEGQYLAKVGNSGHTSEPHLHIHAVKKDLNQEILCEAEGVPILFQDRFLVRNMRINSK